MKSFKDHILKDVPIDHLHAETHNLFKSLSYDQTHYNRWHYNDRTMHDAEPKFPSLGWDGPHERVNSTTGEITHVEYRHPNGATLESSVGDWAWKLNHPAFRGRKDLYPH
jgi:hypothetical protein